jgi:hypothetical protein
MKHKQGKKIVWEYINEIRGTGQERNETFVTSSKVVFIHKNGKFT